MRIGRAGHLMALTLLSGGLLAGLMAGAVGTQRVRKDQTEYLTLAWQLRNEGTLSLAKPGEPPSPTAYRPPGYPAFLALSLLLTPACDGLSPDGFLPPPNVQAHHLAGLLRLQMVLLTLMAAGAFGLAWWLGGSPWAGYLAFFGVGLSPTLWFLAERFYPTLLTGALLLLFSWATVRALRRSGDDRRWVVLDHLLVGLLGAALTLVRAAYLYLLPVVGLLLLARAMRRFRRPAAAWALLAFSLGCGVPLGAWAVRNQAQFGRPYLTHRAGGVLVIRANYNQMTPDERRWAWSWWKDAAARLHVEKTVEMGRWVRLARVHEGGYFRQAHRRIEELVESDLSDTEVEAHLRADGLGRILADPQAHLATTPVFLWRGLIIERERPWWSLLLWAAILLVTVAALRPGRRYLLGLVLPAWWSLLFHTLLSHHLPRYEQPLLPIGYLCMALCLYWGGERVLRRIGR